MYIPYCTSKHMQLFYWSFLISFLPANPDEFWILELVSAWGEWSEILKITNFEKCCKNTYLIREDFLLADSSLSGWSACLCCWPLLSIQTARIRAGAVAGSVRAEICDLLREKGSHILLFLKKRFVSCDSCCISV